MRGFLLAFAMSFTPAIWADTVLDVKTIDGHDVQVALSSLEAGLNQAAAKGKLVSAESIKANADGSFSVNKPKILFNGSMFVISAESDDRPICNYFGFKANGVDRETAPLRAS